MSLCRHAGLDPASSRGVLQYALTLDSGLRTAGMTEVDDSGQAGMTN